ncbi:ER-derived vesicles protein erv46 [Mycoemilia scoparia]|uniref:ER-derived vesicles protein erv46 n=1 Tax=Mycoemilia scoparia TaxID=417184 RepID=A0A9W8DM57_9FUNG|nr:ER-derived vesicles protein erv46 [Mycoemilia scoparia]
MSRKSGSIFKNFKALDAYPKLRSDDDVAEKTKTGALFSVISAIIMAYLVITEFMDYRKIEMKEEVIVNKDMKLRLPINLDITFPNAPCVLLNMDIIDALGEHQSSMFHHITKTRLDRSGKAIETEMTNPNDNSTRTNAALPENYCGSCYGGVIPESGCCNTCDEVHQAYLQSGLPFSNPDEMEQCRRENYIKNIQAQSNEGCRIRGFISVNKVYGNLHIMAGEPIVYNSMNVHAIYKYMPKDYDFSHTIHRLSFGANYNSITDPLSGHSKVAETKIEGYHYFTEVVASEFRYLTGRIFKTNQYSVTEHVTGTEDEIKKHGGRDNYSKYPIFKITYDISPLKFIYTEQKRSLGSFIVSICAIVGGIFTVTGIIDAFVHRTKLALLKKQLLGKLE